MFLSDDGEFLFAYAFEVVFRGGQLSLSSLGPEGLMQ